MIVGSIIYRDRMNFLHQNTRRMGRYLSIHPRRLGGLQNGLPHVCIYTLYIHKVCLYIYICNMIYVYIILYYVYVYIYIYNNIQCWHVLKSIQVIHMWYRLCGVNRITPSATRVMVMILEKHRRLEVALPESFPISGLGGAPYLPSGYD